MNYSLLWLYLITEYQGANSPLHYTGADLLPICFRGHVLIPKAVSKIKHV